MAFLYYSGFSEIFRWITQKKKVTILLLHDPDPKDFSFKLKWLSNRYSFIDFEMYMAYRKGELKLPEFPMIITFDDGHVRNFELMDGMKQVGCKATIFLCSAIVGTNRTFWFERKIPSNVKSEFKTVTNKQRLEKLKGFGYEREIESSHPEALSFDQIEEMKGSFELEAHTRFHPILPSCNDVEARDEIIHCKRELKEKFNLDSKVFAYPNGDYSERDISLCEEAGYELAVTVNTGLNDRTTPPFELNRLSVNDSAWMPEFAVKCSGLWGVIKNKGSRKSQVWGK